MNQSVRVHDTQSAAVLCRDVSYSYGNGNVLEQANLTIAEGEFAWVVGPNGGGKTTLVKMLAGLLKPRTGKITLFGRRVSEVRHRIGYVPQSAQLDLQFPASVLDITLMGRLTSRWWQRTGGRADREIALEALDRVGLKERAGETLGELSGGQQRRLLIARALAGKPDLLLLDEPTANLDPAVERELFRILTDLSQELTIVMVSHDPTYVLETVREVICVNHTVAVHPTTAIEGGRVDHLYGDRTRLVRHDLHDHDE